MEFELKTIRKNPYLTIDFLRYPFKKCGLTVNRRLANEQWRSQLKKVGRAKKLPDTPPPALQLQK
jgi:hypothetical protein